MIRRGVAVGVAVASSTPTTFDLATNASGQAGLKSQQQEIAEINARTQHFRAFESTFLPGLLDGQATKL